MSTGWDNAMLKKLKALMAKKLSTSEIGKRLGVSKNAVVGKLNRLGWNAKANETAEHPTLPLPDKAKKASSTAKAAKKAVGTSAKKPATTKTVKKATEKKTVAKKTAPSTPEKAQELSPTPKKGKDNLNKDLAMHQRIIQHSLEMANLKPNQCRWPIGDPDSEDFHFCGETVFIGKPYCYEHCKQAYQFTPPKKK